MATSSIPPVTGAGSTGTANRSVQSATASASGLSADQFMQLLVAQVQNQDPLNPLSNADFAAQLAQFASLQGINQMNTNFSNLLLVQELTQGSSLIGKTVQYHAPGSADVQQGTVDQVSLLNGQLQLKIGGTAIGLSQVVGITQPSAANGSAGGG